MKSDSLMDLVLFFSHYKLSWTVSISGFFIPSHIEIFNSLLQWTVLPSTSFCEVCTLANFLYLK